MPARPMRTARASAAAASSCRRRRCCCIKPMMMHPVTGIWPAPNSNCSNGTAMTMRRTRPRPVTAMTDKKGMIVVGKTQGLQCGTAYRIKELQAPLGYEINDEQTDFYLTNCGGGAYFGPTNADGSPDASVHQWTGGHTVTIRDKKITGSVPWSKVDGRSSRGIICPAPRGGLNDATMTVRGTRSTIPSILRRLRGRR
mgnify:CR=1 FL=1